MSAEAAKRWYWEHGGKEKKRLYNKAHLSDRKEKEKERWKQKKQALVDMLGGACKCGYSKLSGLTFHHNGDKNDDVSNMRDKPLEVLMDEIKDAELLCMNCHMELHYGWLDS